MCHVSSVVFVGATLRPEDVAGRRVLEVGSYDVNGSVRPLLDVWGPSEYVGVDLRSGPGVDVVADAARLRDVFPDESFDVVVSTETLEHVRDWRGVVSGMKHLCKPGGAIVVATVSRGFPYHGAPFDYWRYELEDMAVLFGDCELLSLEHDPEVPGVFVHVRKPAGFEERDLSGVELYNIVRGRRAAAVAERDRLSLRYGILRTKDLALRAAIPLGRAAFRSI